MMLDHMTWRHRSRQARHRQYVSPSSHTNCESSTKWDFRPLQSVRFVLHTSRQPIKGTGSLGRPSACMRLDQPHSWCQEAERDAVASVYVKSVVVNSGWMCLLKSYASMFLWSVK